MMRGMVWKGKARLRTQEDTTRARDDPYRYRSYRRLGYAYGRENEREMAGLSQATLDSASHVQCRLVPGRWSLPGGMFMQTIYIANCAHLL